MKFRKLIKCKKYARYESFDIQIENDCIVDSYFYTFFLKYLLFQKKFEATSF